MTTTRLTLLTFAILLSTASTHAEPPAGLAGQYLLLQANRLEFNDASTGSDGTQAITYEYSVTGQETATLKVSYPSTGRLRQISLNFLADGTPDQYLEFDVVSTNPPMPPQIRSGTFEIGDLVVTPPPPIESTAPESLVGSFVKAGRLRFEFLTGDRGRRFIPGAAEYFRYTYRIIDEFSAEAVLSEETADRVTKLTLTFEEEGEEGSYTTVVTENGIEAAGNEGEFELGENRNLTDLKIGTEAEDLLGDDLYGSSGHHQTVKRLLTRSGPVVFHFALQNDGNTDAFRLRATDDRRTFDIAYYSYPERENLTAALTTGRYETSPLGHGETRAFTLEIAPNRSTGALVTRVEARSLSVRNARDEVHSFTLLKSKEKPTPPRGKHGRR